MESREGTSLPAQLPFARWATTLRAASEIPASSSLAVWSLIRPEILTWANLMTLSRLLGSMAAFGVAMMGGGDRWNYIGLAIYWAGDMADGMLARGLKQETVFGAEFDILSDRILVCLFYMIYVAGHPEKTAVALLFLLEFMVLDHWLSNQFIRWPIKSPNDFHRVDHLTWQWLWSTPGKALNTGLVTLMTIFITSPWPPALVAGALLVVRLFFFFRVLSMTAGQRQAAKQ